MAKRKGRPRKKPLEHQSDYTRIYRRRGKTPKRKEVEARRKFVKRNSKHTSDSQLAREAGVSKETIARDRRSQGIYRRRKRK